MKFLLILTATVLGIGTAFANEIPIHRFKINPNQADDLDTIFLGI